MTRPHANSNSIPAMPMQLTLIVLIVVVSLGLPMLPVSFPAKIGIAVLLVIPGVVLARLNLPAFVPSLFFIINAAMSPFVHATLGKLALTLPQLYFLPPIVAYVVIVFASPSLRREVHWLRRGTFNRRTVRLMIILVVGSAIALISWALFVAENLQRFREFVPNVGLPLLFLYGLLFPVANSIFEEFMSRAVMYDGFSAVFRRALPVILLQAFLFALWHFNGFPGGVVGVCLVFVWSILLGYIRQTSGGILAPLVAHYFADLTIAIIVFVLVVV